MKLHDIAPSRPIDLFFSDPAHRDACQTGINYDRHHGRCAAEALRPGNDPLWICECPTCSYDENFNILSETTHLFVGGEERENGRYICSYCAAGTCPQ